MKVPETVCFLLHYFILFIFIFSYLLVSTGGMDLNSNVT